jgi:hypothetical protein
VTRPVRCPDAFLVPAGLAAVVFLRGRGDGSVVDCALRGEGLRLLVARRGAVGRSSSGSRASAIDSSSLPTPAAADCRFVAASRRAAEMLTLSFTPLTVAAGGGRERCVAEKP